MPRVRKGAARTQAKKRLRRLTRGYERSRVNQRGEAKHAIRSSGVYAYRDRRTLKRNMRALWITRLTAACKMRGTKYSVLVHGLKFAGIALNRKMLSELAIQDPVTFDAIVKQALAAVPKPAKTAKAA